MGAGLPSALAAKLIHPDKKVISVCGDGGFMMNSQEMETAVRALARVLRAHRFWVPQWFKDTHTVAYYDQYEHPANLPPFALGELDFWWFNAAKHEALLEAGALR